MALSPMAHRLTVFCSVAAMVALSSYQVFSKKPSREGHDALSSEKPAALRGEAPRDIATEKRKIAEADAAKALRR